MQKRYNDEIQTAKDELLGKDGRDPEAYINRVMEINATYAGLTKSGSYQVSMSNGQDGLTSNEIMQSSRQLLAAEGTVVKGEMQLQKIANMEKEVQGSTMSLSAFLQEHQYTMERRKNNGMLQTSALGLLFMKTVDALNKFSKLLKFESDIEHASTYVFKQNGNQNGSQKEKIIDGKGSIDGLPDIDPKMFPGVTIKVGVWAEFTGRGYFDVDDNTIYVPEGTTTAYVQHEYGHYLQSKHFTKEEYQAIEYASFMDALFSTSTEHEIFWTERDANRRAIAFFGPNSEIARYGLWPK